MRPAAPPVANTAGDYKKKAVRLVIRETLRATRRAQRAGGERRKSKRARQRRRPQHQNQPREQWYTDLVRPLTPPPTALAAATGDRFARACVLRAPSVSARCPEYRTLLAFHYPGEQSGGFSSDKGRTKEGSACLRARRACVFACACERVQATTDTRRGSRRTHTNTKGGVPPPPAAASISSSSNRSQSASRGAHNLSRQDG